MIITTSVPKRHSRPTFCDTNRHSTDSSLFMSFNAKIQTNSYGFELISDLVFIYSLIVFSIGFNNFRLISLFRRIRCLTDRPTGCQHRSEPVCCGRVVDVFSETQMCDSGRKSAATGSDQVVHQRPARWHYLRQLAGRPVSRSAGSVERVAITSRQLLVPGLQRCRQRQPRLRSQTTGRSLYETN